jgi:hypothetical protein
VVFRGSALDDLRAVPQEARRAAGYRTDRVQSGRDPDDWKPMTSIGPGVRDPHPGSRRRLSRDLRGEILGRRVHSALLPQVDAEDGIRRYLAKRRYTDLVRE